jgi:hypothetical protein
MAAAGHRARKPAMPTEHRGGVRFVVDVETQTCEVSALTVDQARAMTATLKVLKNFGERHPARAPAEPACKRL